MWGHPAAPRPVHPLWHCCLGEWPTQLSHTLQQLAGDPPGGGWTPLSQAGHTCHSSWFKIPKSCKPGLFCQAREPLAPMACPSLNWQSRLRQSRQAESSRGFQGTSGRPGCADPRWGGSVPIAGLNQKSLQTHFSVERIMETFTRVSPPCCLGPKGGAAWGSQAATGEALVCCGDGDPQSLCGERGKDTALWKHPMARLLPGLGWALLPTYSEHPPRVCVGVGPALTPRISGCRKQDRHPRSNFTILCS